MAVTTVGVAPIVLKDLTLVIDDYEFAAAISGVLFTPKTTTVTWRGGTPASKHSDTVVESWDCRIDFAQDIVTANSLSQFLIDNAGDRVEALFQPSNDTLKGIEATLILAPGPIGGTVGQYMTGSVTLGVDGEPTLVTVTE